MHNRTFFRRKGKNILGVSFPPDVDIWSLEKATRGQRSKPELGRDKMQDVTKVHVRLNPRSPRSGIWQQKCPIEPKSQPGPRSLLLWLAL